MSVQKASRARRARAIGVWHIRCYERSVTPLQRLQRCAQRAGVLAALLLIPDCAAPERDSGLANLEPLCRANRDCPSDAECVRSRCVSRQTESVPLLVEVIAPAGTPGLAGVAIAQEVQFASREFDIHLGYSSAAVVHLKSEPVVDDACLARLSSQEQSEEDPVPPSARVTFFPRKRQLGLTDAARVVTTTTPSLDDVSLSITLVPGKYDLYVEPLEHDGECLRPPELFLDHEVTASDVSLSIQLGAPQRYDARVRFPASEGSLEGWRLDLVDPDSGLALSSGAVLSDPREAEGTLEYDASVVFVPVHSGTPRTEMVRLTPPEGVTAPTLLVARGVTELFQSDPAIVDQLTSLPKTVTLSGRVVLKGTLDGVEAGLTFVLESLSGLAEGTSVSFSREVRTGTDGTFEASLLPGTYRVVTQPASDQLAQSEEKFSVSGGTPSQAGRTIEIAERRSIQGRLFDFRGNPVAKAQVDLVPVPTFHRGGLALSASAVRFVPSGLAGETESDGRFRLLADAGRFDIVARNVTKDADFSWAFRLGVTVGDGDVVLGDLTERPPLLVHGSVSAEQTGPLPSALIRAYAYVKAGEVSTPDAAEYVLLVGETRANADGDYQLLLPADLAATDD